MEEYTNKDVQNERKHSSGYDINLRSRFYDRFGVYVWVIIERNGRKIIVQSQTNPNKMLADFIPIYQDVGSLAVKDEIEIMCLVDESVKRLKKYLSHMRRTGENAK